MAELDDFDWMNHKGDGPAPKPFFQSIMQLSEPEKPYDRKMRMLVPLKQACFGCSMCELGLNPAQRGNIARDPHVFSNMMPHRFMVVGQNPGWTELEKGEPFVGDAGQTFDIEIAKHELSRDQFYICNVVRCFTQSNTRPSAYNLERCEPFLHMEINLIKPKLIIALGSVAFGQLCPNATFMESLKKITKSKKFNDVPVFAVYHPSPLNLQDSGREAAFKEQIKVMCELVKAIKKRDDIKS